MMKILSAATITFLFALHATSAPVKSTTHPDAEKLCQENCKTKNVDVNSKNYKTCIKNCVPLKAKTKTK